jgi:peptide/nickel transport system ATP-binding protein
MTGTPLLAVENLHVSYEEQGRRQPIVHGIDFTVTAGEVVALVGESGSGKSTVAQSIIHLLPENGHIDRGSIRLNGTDIATWSERRFDALRGQCISLVPQDPVVSLNPVRTIGSQVEEILDLHEPGGRWQRGRRASLRGRAVGLLAWVGLRDPELRARQYPHELSGGMKQRVLIAIALALKPQLVIADEPTSALDVTVQRHILDLIDELRAEAGTALLLVTHDLAVAAERADRLIMLRTGRIVEQGPTPKLLSQPQSDYAKRLLADAPSFGGSHRLGTAKAFPQPVRGPANRPDAIVVENLTQVFPVRGSPHSAAPAVDNLSFRVPRGTTHALVGESGSGKTTTIRAILGLLKPTAGRVLIDGSDIATLSGEALRRLRRKVQLVYQNPFSSLDPRQSVFQAIEEPLKNFEPVPRDERAARVRAILDRVHLPADVLDRRPRALSGGQRQRVAIARALILEPGILVLDEAVSALDVTVQAQILDLLDELQGDLGLSYLFVSHDLAVVRQISDTVSVLHQGRLAESGVTEEIFDEPASGYTRELIDAVPGRRLGTTPIFQPSIRVETA